MTYPRRIQPVRSALIAALLVVLAGCSSGGGDSDGEGTGGGGSSEPPPAADLRITTFNAGLLPSFGALTDERVSPVGSALASTESDVLCVQELWRDADRASVQAAISSRYPFQLFVPPRNRFASHAPVCSESDLDPLLLCLATSCLADSASFVDCAVASCKEDVFRLADRNPECATALFAQTGRSISELFSIQDELFSSTERARLFAFDGSSGLLLASRYPLEESQILDFYDVSTTSRRAAIFSTIEVNGSRQHIGCTHLTSNLDGLLPYTGTRGSWEGEANTQASEMISFAAAYAAGGAEYLAGDFNCSEANSAFGVQSDFAQNCRAFRNAGYRDPAGESLSCSYCAGNALIQQNSHVSGNVNTLLDHIFIKPAAQNAVPEIVLTAEISAGGNSVPPSDHYGVRLNLTLP